MVTVGKGFRKLDEDIMAYRRFGVATQHWEIDGKVVERNALISVDAVVIIPVTPEGRIVFIRNFRTPVEEEVLELPAGKLDPKGGIDGSKLDPRKDVDSYEEPVVAGERELSEETGYTAESFHQIGENDMALDNHPGSFSSPGMLTERFRFVLAVGARKSTEQHLDEAEGITDIIEVPWMDAFRNALSGEIKDTKTRLGVLMYGMKRLNEENALKYNGLVP